MGNRVRDPLGFFSGLQSVRITSPTSYVHFVNRKCSSNSVPVSGEGNEGQGY